PSVECRHHRTRTSHPIDFFASGSRLTPVYLYLCSPSKTARVSRRNKVAPASVRRPPLASLNAGSFGQMIGSTALARPLLALKGIDSVTTTNELDRLLIARVQA